MELRNCPQCNKLFAYTIRNLCPECSKKEDENFDKVRDYIYSTPEATIEEVSKNTGVPIKTVLEYLKEGRLMLRDNNTNILLHCEVCNEPILTGRLCEKCARKFKKGFESKPKPLLRHDMTGKIHLSKLSKDKKYR